MRGQNNEKINNSINIITGPTGSGKSGVVDLLLKMNRPHKGTIMIGKQNIFDIKIFLILYFKSCTNFIILLPSQGIFETPFLIILFDLL